MKILPLGTNGFFPSFGRQTMCFAVPFGDTLILLDAGTGLFRLVEPEGKKLLENVSRVHIFLSHDHLDHTFGFYGAWKLLKDKKVTVFGEGNEGVFSELTRKYFPIRYQREHGNFQWKNISLGQNSIGNYAVLVRKQSHNKDGSLAFRFRFPDGEDFSYVTDSEPTKESVDFVRGTNLLLHEHYLPGEEILKKKKVKLEDHFLGGHTTTVGAAMIAKEAKVGKLVLIHHYPYADSTQLEFQLRQGEYIFPPVVLARDLELLTVQ